MKDDRIQIKGNNDGVNVIIDMEKFFGFDVMLEAKKKDITLNTLVKDLKHITKDIKFIDNSTFEI